MRSGCPRVLVVAFLLAGCGKELNADFCLAHPEDARCQVGADSGIDGPSLDAALGCPASYALTLPGTSSRYRVEDTVDSWTNAASACADDGQATGANTHLLVLSNTTEREALVDIADRERWVGHSDAVAEGTWVPVTHEDAYPELAALAQPPWSGSPDGGTSSNCAVLGQDLLLRDRKCTDETQAYVCECDAYPDDPDNY